MTMADGATSSITAAAFGVTLFGMSTGLYYDTLLASFLGSLVSLSFLGQMTWGKRFWSIFTSTLTGGYLFPLILAGLAKAVDVAMLPGNGSMVAAFLTGLGAQIGIPVLFNWMKKRGEAQQGI